MNGNDDALDIFEGEGGRPPVLAPAPVTISPAQSAEETNALAVLVAEGGRDDLPA